MRYILVRSVMYPNSSFSGITTIEGNISENTRRQLPRRQLHGERSLGGDYETYIDPWDVLNVLETEGYKVVGTNTVTRFESRNDLTTSSHYMIWTLHKQA